MSHYVASTTGATPWTLFSSRPWRPIPMAVSKRSYRAYSGRLTPSWSRFLVLTRYALRSLFRSKFLLAVFVMSYFSPLICAVLIYLNHNSTIMNLLHARHNEVMNVNGEFFLGFLGVQGGIAF